MRKNIMAFSTAFLLILLLTLSANAAKLNLVYDEAGLLSEKES